MDEDEIPRLRTLYDRGIQNGAKDLRMVDKHEIKDIEPNCEVSTVGFLAWCDVLRSHGKLLSRWKW